MRKLKLLLLVTLIFCGCFKNTPKIIRTPEIIRILKEEDIAFIKTSHSQVIKIRLENGKKYEGKYNYKKAGEYSQYTDILNLVRQIKEQRPSAVTNGWYTSCE